MKYTRGNSFNFFFLIKKTYLVLKKKKKKKKRKQESYRITRDSRNDRKTENLLARQKLVSNKSHKQSITVASKSLPKLQIGSK